MSISTGDIQVQNKITKKKLSSTVHLKCFEPLFPSLIKPQDVHSLLLSKENWKRVQAWVKFWNSKHYISIPKMLEKCVVAPSFSFKPPETAKNYSIALIFSMTFLDLRELLLNFALVSRFFYALTFNNFFWKEVCFIHFKHEDVNVIIDKFYRAIRPISEEWVWKEICFLIINHCCLECKKLDFERMRVCPILKKPLCEDCRKKDKFRLISVSEINRNNGGYLAYFLDNFSGKFGWNHKHEKVFYKFYVQKCKKAANSSSMKIKKEKNNIF